MVLLLQFRYIFCLLLLLFCIFSNILLLFVHACHNTEEFSFNIVTRAFHIMSIHGISALVLPVFPPYLPIIFRRVICIFSDIYLVGYAILLLAALR